MAEEYIERGMNSELYNYKDKIQPNDKTFNTVVSANETRVRYVISNIIDNNIQNNTVNNSNNENITILEYNNMFS